MIHRCETCPFWKPVKGHGWGTCQLAETQEDGFVKHGTLAWATDKAPINPRLLTNKAFGCVSHPMNKAIL